MSGIIVIMLCAGGLLFFLRTFRLTLAWVHAPVRPSWLRTFLEVSLMVGGLLLAIDLFTDPSGWSRGFDVGRIFVIAISLLAGFGTVFSLWCLRLMWRRFVPAPRGSTGQPEGPGEMAALGTESDHESGR